MRKPCQHPEGVPQWWHPFGVRRISCGLQPRALEFHAFGVRVNATAPDAFPRLISTDSVTDSIVRLETGTLNGKVLVLNKDGVRVLAAP